MIVLTRYRVADGEDEEFLELGSRALQALTAQRGCTGARLARNVDDPGLWTLTTTWAQVGDYRRALSAYDVKVHAVPVMYRAVDEPSAYEELVSWSPDTGPVQHRPGRAEDADRTGPSR